MHAVPVVLAAPVRATRAWSEHRDPAGFRLLKPSAWRVQTGDPGDFAVTDPHGRAAALVRTRALPPRTELAQWLLQRYAATEPGLHNVRVLRVRAVLPQVAQAAYDYGSEVFRGRASVIAVRHGEVATLLVAAAAREQFAERLPELTRILESVRLGGPLHSRDPAIGASLRVAGRQRHDLCVVGAGQPAAVGTEAEFEPAGDLVLRRLLKIGMQVAQR